MEKETLYRYVACQASPEEETAVLTWLEADPAHESELAKVQRQHDLVALSAPVINELYAKDRRRRFGSVLRRWSAAAAAVVLLAFGGYYFHAARDFSRQGERLLSVSVPHGQRVSLTLQDGTSVWLNAGTTLRYPALFTGRERRVEIDGEARFEVVHDAKHPFIVRTYACDVEVLGTKFDVMAEEREGLFSAALLRGSVKVTNRLTPGEQFVLKPNEEVRLAGRRLNLNAIGSMDDYLWTEGMISIKGLSFGELMHKFEKSFGVKIRIDRARMPEVDYNHGKIRISDGIEHALCILQRSCSFHYAYEQETSTITIY